MKARFTDEQIIAMIKEQESGEKTADLRRHYRTGRIAYSLRTKSVRDAHVRAMSDA